MSHRIALTILAAALAAGAAEAQRFKEGTAGATALSGYRGTQIKLSAYVEGLYGLKWEEDADRPCKLVMLTRDLANGADIGEADEGLYLCPETQGFVVQPLPGVEIPGSGANRTVDFGSSPRYYVRGLSVCANQSNHRLKGIRILAAKVWAGTNKVEALSASDQAQMPNCGASEWHPTVTCPAGSVAFGLVVHYDDRSITGLALRCKEVTQ